MASSFNRAEPAVERGRLIPSEFVAPVGDHVYVLGALQPGWRSRFNPGEYSEITQTASPDPGSRIVRLSCRLRGPARMPLLSALEPFVLSPGQTLVFSVAGAAAVAVTIDAADFANVAAARAAELAAVINRDLAGASARLEGDGSFSIVSDAEGRRSGVASLGGTGAPAVGFQALAWRASLRVNGVEAFSTLIAPGDLRDLSDFGAALPGFGAGPYPITFRLEVVAL